MDEGQGREGKERGGKGGKGMEGTGRRGTERKGMEGYGRNGKATPWIFVSRPDGSVANPPSPFSRTISVAFRSRRGRNPRRGYNRAFVTKPISPFSRRVAIALKENADAIFIADIPFGCVANPFSPF